MKQATTSNREQLQADAIAALKNHQQRIEETAYAGQFEEHIYHALGGKEFESRPYEYRKGINDFFAALAMNPDVAIRLKESMPYWYDAFMEGISNFAGLCDDLSKDQFQLHLQAWEIEQHPTHYKDEYLAIIAVQHEKAVTGILGYSEARAQLERQPSLKAA